MKNKWIDIFSPLTTEKNFLKDIKAGIAITTFAMIGIFIVSLSLGFIHIEGYEFHIKSFLYYTGLTFIASGYEELIYRVILLSLLIKVLKKPWVAILLTSIVFGLMHASNDHATWLSVISNGLGGVMYGLAFVGTRKIWFPWALHFAWNYVQATILGFPVSGFEVRSIIILNIQDHSLLSGGLYGPEGGVVGISFRFVVIILILIWIKKSRGSLRNIIS